MKRFKMGVLNNFQTHKMYSTNRKIIYQDKIKPPKPEKIILKPNPAAENQKKNPPTKSFCQSSKTLIIQNHDLKWVY